MMKLSVKSDNKVKWIASLCLFWIFCVFFNIPHVLVIFPVLKECYGEVIVGLSIVMFILYLVLKKHPEKDRFFLTSFVLFLYIVILSLIRDQTSLKVIYYNYFAFPLASVLLFSLFFERNFKKYLLALFVYYFVLACLNNYSMLKYAEIGMSLANGTRDVAICLVGNIDLSFVFSMVALVSGVLCAELFCKWIWIGNVLQLLFSIYVSYKRDCDTALITLVLAALILILMLLIKKLDFLKKPSKIFSGFFYIGLSIAACLTLMYLSINKITIFGMDPGFHGRGVIWEHVLEVIRQHPLIGRGGRDSIIVPGKVVAHAHNIYLQYWYTGGLIGILAILFLFVQMAGVVGKIKDTALRFGMAGLFGCFLIALQLDAFTTLCCFTFFSVFFYAVRYAVEYEKEHALQGE